MTDVLLTHGFFLKNDPKQIEKMKPYPPLATLYAASYLRSRGYTVALFDAMFATDENDLREVLKELRPRFVAIYEDKFNFLNKMCLSHAREAACRMAEAARDSGAVVIAAGSDVSDHTEVYLSRGVEFAVVGEADHTLVELLETLDGHRPRQVRDVAGLALMDDHGVALRTPPRGAERHPDVFPLPAWDLIDTERYRDAWRQAHGYFSLNLVTTRGCPFHCNWCAKPIWGQRYAMRSPANVAEEMALVKRAIRPDHVWFADDIFGLQPRWVAEFAHEIEIRDAAIPFMIQSRVDLMTEKAVGGLRRAGCAEVWLGVESGSQKVLDAMDKGTRVEAIPIARERLRQAGIRACFFLQFGYPGETWGDIQATIQLVRETLPDDIGISVSYPLPGTKFHNMVSTEFAAKDHWESSDDLDMMFHGTYSTAFYRHLHRTLHDDLKLRQREAVDLESPHGTESSIKPEKERVAARWRELERLEPECRSAAPTLITKDYAPPSAPDLRRSWSAG